MSPAFKLNSLINENCQSRRETNNATLHSQKLYIKGTLCAFFQHKHLFLLLICHFTSLHLHKYSSAEYDDQPPGLSETFQENIGNDRVKSKRVKQVEGKVGASKWQMAVIHHSTCPEMH